MKKMTVLLMVGVMVMGMTACSNREIQPQYPQVEQGAIPIEPTVTETVENTGLIDEVVDGIEGEEGFSEEMAAVRDAVMEELGEDYWPNMQIPKELLESVYGLTPDMYVDYMGEMPMMSTQVDTILVVKVTDEQADAVEAALQDYRNKTIEDSLQYPMNLGKVQGSMVERVGNYVCFVQLGGDVLDAADIGNEEIIKHSMEHNRRAIEAIRGTTVIE